MHKISRKITIYRLLLFSFFTLYNAFVFSQAVETPDETSVNPENTNALQEQRYTQEEFVALTDDEKRDIYFNAPQKLPLNFQPDLYMHLFHPELPDPLSGTGNAEIIPDNQ